MAAILILISACLYGVSPILAKIAYGYGVTPLVLMTWRVSIAAALFWSAALAFRQVAAVERRMLGALVVLGTTFVPAQVYSYFFALSLLPASTASVIVNTSPVHVAWMERLALGEQLARRDLLILGVIVAGAILVGGATPHAGHAFGFVVLGAATLASAFYLVVQRRVVRDVPPIMILAVVQVSSAAVYWIAVAVTRERLAPLPPPALAAIVASTFAASIASFLVLIALRTLAATRTAMLGMLEPVVTVILSVALLADPMTWPRLAGIVTVLAGITTFYWRLRQPVGTEVFAAPGSDGVDSGAF
ncbi:MAG TPA: DMT family transporter [bacterium]|nr:DMT family transporter [bacterium]